MVPEVLVVSVIFSSVENITGDGKLSPKVDISAVKTIDRKGVFPLRFKVTTKVAIAEVSNAVK